MSKKNRIWCILIVGFILLIVGTILCCLKAESEAEKEKGYLIRQTKEEQNVSRA